MSHWEWCRLDLWSATAEWQDWWCKKKEKISCSLWWTISQVRLKMSLSIAESSRRCSEHVLLLNCYIHFHLKDADESMVSWQRGQEESELKKQSCCLCNTGQTGSRQVKRHSEGKRERHRAISSQSGCTGLVGEGEGFTTAAFTFLNGWQEDMSRGRFFFSISHPSYHKIIYTTAFYNCSCQ